MKQPRALDVIAEAPPTLSSDVVAAHVADRYGLVGELTQLVSERDQNFRLRTDSNEQYVVKIANRVEAKQITEFLVGALLHLETRRCPVATPRVMRASDGSALTRITWGDTSLCLRIVTWLEGKPVGSDMAADELARDVGRCLAEIDTALRDFEHPGQKQSLLWDMQRAADVAQLAHHITDEGLRRAITSCIGDFEQRVTPQLDHLRTQVIHNDINPGNILVSEDNPCGVAGIIDFGDMVKAPLIADVAIACAYQRRFDEHLLEPLKALVSGFHSVMPLQPHEVELLYDLLRARLATTIAILHWRIAARSGDDAYLRKTLAESTAEQFLDAIDAIPRSEFTAHMTDALSGSTRE